MSVVIETTLGDFTVDLFVDERPQACKNFLKLCKIKYYNLCLFHSVQHKFIAQSGDPSGTGKSGESVFRKTHGEERKYFAAEMMPRIKHSKAGLLSMVNCGDNMLGSQFFITLSSELQSLDSEHCVFGELGEGHEILLKLNEVICDNEHRPYQDIRITHTVILEDPFDDPPGLEIPDQSPEPTKENLVNGRIAPDEELDEGKGLSAQQLEEMVRAREAQAQATILEIVGDLPDADMAPPENVLFICKLNPVTSDDDLEIIFSRFGKVKSCEVIRDKVTGDSLQYAFVEFEEQKSCEDAFFKMDNVLIDDRRIHVDFSQSVSKLRWKGKGRGVEHIGESNFKKSADNSDRRDPQGGRADNKSRGDERLTKNERGNDGDPRSTKNYRNTRDERPVNDRHGNTSERRFTEQKDDHRDRPSKRLKAHDSERDSSRSQQPERHSERERSSNGRSNKVIRSRDHVKEVDRKRTKEDEDDGRIKKMHGVSDVERRSSKQEDPHRRPRDISKTNEYKDEGRSKKMRGPGVERRSEREDPRRRRPHDVSKTKEYEDEGRSKTMRGASEVERRSSRQEDPYKKPSNIANTKHRKSEKPKELTPSSEDSSSSSSDSSEKASRRKKKKDRETSRKVVKVKKNK